MVAVVATLAAVAALGRDAFVAVPDVKPITAHDARRRLRARAAARLQRRRARHARVELRARPGPVHAVADGRVGPRRARRRGARRAQPPAARARAARARLRARGVRGEGGDERLHVDARREPHAGGVPGGRPARRCRSTSPTRSRASSSASPSRPELARLLARHARAHGRQLGAGRAARRDPGEPAGARAGRAGTARRTRARGRARPRPGARHRQAAGGLGGLVLARAVLPGLCAEPGRRLRRVHRAAQQRAVHGVGRDGPCRGRAQPGERASQRALAA